METTQKLSDSNYGGGARIDGVKGDARITY